MVSALVSTCIDPETIRILEARVDQCGQSAERILEITPRFSANVTDDAVDDGSSVNDTRNPALAVADRGTSVRFEDYPPDRIGELLQCEELEASYARSEILSEWLCHWAENGCPLDALDAVESYLLNDERARIKNELVLLVKRTDGRTRSYGWLVKAQRSNHGWQEYWTNPDETRERWRFVKLDHPDRWHDFLVASIEPSPGYPWAFGNTVTRLAEYLGYMDRWDDACAVVTQLAHTVDGLVKGQRLPVPSWVNDVGDNR